MVLMLEDLTFSRGMDVNFGLASTIAGPLTDTVEVMVLCCFAVLAINLGLWGNMIVVVTSHEYGPLPHYIWDDHNT